MADKMSSSLFGGQTTASDSARKRKPQSECLSLTDDARSTKQKQSITDEEHSACLQRNISAEPTITQGNCTLQTPSNKATNRNQQQNLTASFTTPQASNARDELSTLLAIHNRIAQQKALSGIIQAPPEAALTIPNMIPAATLSGLLPLANALNQQNSATILMPTTSLLSNMPLVQMVPVAQYPSLLPSPSALPLSVGRSDLLQALLLNNSVSATTDQNKIIDALTQPGTSVIPHATLPRTDNASASQEHGTPTGGGKAYCLTLSDSTGPTKSSEDCLYMPGDDGKLSEHQVMIRKQIEIYETTEYDLQWNTQGRKAPLVLGQAGVRCRHCVSKPLRMRGRGSVYYPTSLLGLYQACQNMANTHLRTMCTSIDPKLREELKLLSRKKEKTGGCKQYWADRGESLGLYEVDKRLFRRAQEES